MHIAGIHCHYNGRCLIRTKFTFKGTSQQTICARTDRPVNALQLLPLTVFTQRNFVADFLRKKSTFIWETAILHFWAPLGGLETAYDVHLRLIGKHVVDFLLVITELFLLGVTAKALWANIDWKSLFFEGRGSRWSKISGRRGHPPPTILHVRKLDATTFHTV